MENVAKIAGCRLAFDNFASTSLPLCVGKNWKKYADFAIQMISTEQKIIVNVTGCQGKYRVFFNEKFKVSCPKSI